MRSAGYNMRIMTSHLERSVVIRPPRSRGNYSFDIYSCSTSVPDVLVVCSLFYWAWWVSLSLLVTSTSDSVTTAMYPPDSTRGTIDQTADGSWRRHKGRHSHRFLNVSIRGTRMMIRNIVCYGGRAGGGSVTNIWKHGGRLCNILLIHLPKKKHLCKERKSHWLLE